MKKNSQFNCSLTDYKVEASFNAFPTQGMTDLELAQVSSLLKYIDRTLMVDFARKMEDAFEKYDYIYVGGVNQYNDEGYDEYFYMYHASKKEHALIQGEELEDEDDEDDEVDISSNEVDISYNTSIEDTLASNFMCHDAEYSSDFASFQVFSKETKKDFLTTLLGSADYEKYKIMSDKNELEKTVNSAKRSAPGVSKL